MTSASSVFPAADIFSRVSSLEKMYKALQSDSSSSAIKAGRLDEKRSKSAFMDSWHVPSS